MRYILSLLLDFGFSLTIALAQSPTQETADSAYQTQDYEKAIAQYHSLLKVAPSADIFYNMGNAHFRQKEMGKAVLAYERALHLSPNHQDARYNLEIVRSRLTDRFSPKPTLLSNILSEFIETQNVSTWVGWSLVYALCTLLLALIYRLSTPIWLRKIGFFGAIISLIFFFTFTAFALVQRNAFYNNTRAVIIATSVQSYSSPTESSNKARLLHEGTTIDIIEHSGQDWLQAELPDGSAVWLKKNAIEEVITNF